MDGIQLVVGCPEITAGVTHIGSKEDGVQLDQLVSGLGKKGGWQ